MFRNSRELTQISLLDFVGEEILVRDRSTNRIILFAKDFSIIWEVKLENARGKYKSISANEFMYFMSGLGFIYSKSSGVKIAEDRRYFYRYEKGNSVFIDDVEPEVIVSEKYSTTIPYEIVWEHLYEDFLFQYEDNKSILTCRSLKTGGVLWQADVAELGNWLDYDGKTTVKGKVKNVYPIDEDLVVVEIARSYLAAFRISTGEQLWQHNGPYTTFYNVSLYNNTFHIFSDYYYELDAQTGKELRREEFAPLLKQAGIRQSFLTQPAVNEKYIAIASHYDSAILLINRADFTVAQRIDLEGCQSGIPLPNTPRFHGNRLFQLDGDGTLHVFEED
jgi:outer membrane protein assembly factor BamB